MSEEDSIPKEVAFIFMRERDKLKEERDAALAKLAELETQKVAEIKHQETKQREATKDELPKFDQNGKPIQYFSSFL